MLLVFIVFSLTFFFAIRFFSSQFLCKLNQKLSYCLASNHPIFNIFLTPFFGDFQLWRRSCCTLTLINAFGLSVEAFPTISQGMSEIRESLDDTNMPDGLNSRCEYSTTCVMIFLDFWISLSLALLDYSNFWAAFSILLCRVSMVIIGCDFVKISDFLVLHHKFSSQHVHIGNPKLLCVSSETQSIASISVAQCWMLLKKVLVILYLK